MATGPVTAAARGALKKVKPILSLDKNECRRRVISLYKAWYRQLPNITKCYEIPLNISELKMKLREEFMKNKHVEDIRIIDILLVKGEIELKEVVEGFQQASHIMFRFRDSVPEKPKDFLSKFLRGNE